MRDSRLPHDWFVRGEGLASGFPLIDFQMHTRWTDGSSSVSEMIAGGRLAGLNAIAITEHVNHTSTWYSDFAADVEAERQRACDLAIYHGVEIAAADYRGTLKVDASRFQAELVLGVVHRYPKRDGSGFWRFEDLNVADAVELELQALAGLATNQSIDVLGHPGGTAFKKFGAFPVQWLEEAFRTARDHGVAVELNTKYLWDLEGMLALLRDINPLVSFGSDAHSADQVGCNVKTLSEALSKRMSLALS